MRTLLSAMIVLTALAAFGCSSTSGGNSSGSGGGSPSAGVSSEAKGWGRAAGAAQPANAEAVNWTLPGPAPRQRPNAPAKSNASARSNRAPSKPPPKSPEVSVLKLDQSEVPAAVRAIETVIDKRSALLADTIRIEVSKNYEWDVSLSGDGVSPHRPDQGGTIAEATGNPRAYFRNLDIRARNKIVLWRSGLGVTPFIRIYATGAVSYIDTDDSSGKPRVKRAGTCKISNASIAFDEQILGVPGMEAGAVPTALREKGN